MLPLWMDLAGKRAVVFGGGPVGRRKANYLVAEAEVTVVARTFEDGFDPRISLVGGEIRNVIEQWVGKADLIVAATQDHDLNDDIAEAAARSGKPCNRADGISTFLIPSVVVRESYTVAISTEGRSPGMSKFLRLKLDGLLGPQYDRMVRLQEELRSAARVTVPDQRERERMLWEVLEDQAVWDLLNTDEEAARELAMKRLVR